MYFKKGKAKIEIAIAKGKKNMIKEQLKKIEIGAVIKQDTLENQVKSIYLGIGSNLGNRKVILKKQNLLFKKILKY